MPLWDAIEHRPGLKSEGDRQRRECAASRGDPSATTRSSGSEATGTAPPVSIARTWDGPGAKARGLRSYVLRNKHSPPVWTGAERDAEKRFPTMPMRPPIFRPPGWKPSPNKRAAAQDSFYQSHEWKQLATYVKERDGFQCTEPKCSTPGRGHGGRLIAGHIIARGQPGGVDRPSNVRNFCPTCDNRWHSEKGRLGAR
jgi:hypothetical protein